MATARLANGEEIELPEGVSVASRPAPAPSITVGGKGNSALPGGVKVPPPRERMDPEQLAQTREINGVPLPEGVSVVGRAGSTPMDALKAFGGGALETGANILPLATAATGGIVGFGAGGLPGGAAGVLAGGGAGLNARTAILDMVDIPTSDELPEDLRPFRFAGEVFGGSVPGLGPLFGAAKTGFRLLGNNFLGRMFNNAVNTAAARPLATLGAEASATVGSGTFEAISEGAFPGNEPLRIASGVVGGVLSPGQAALNATEAGASALAAVQGRFSNPAINRRAADEYARVLSAEGGSVDSVLASLDQVLKEFPDLKDSGATVGALTGNRRMLAAERTLEIRDNKFADASEAGVSKALEIMRRSEVLLTRAGDPASLQRAAELRQERLGILLDGVVSDAERQISTVAQRIRGRAVDDADISALSRRGTQIVEESLRRARRAESELYAAVPNMAAAGDNILAEATDLRTNFLSELSNEQLPEQVRAAVRNLTQEVDPTTGAVTKESMGVTVTSLQRFRSEMLAAARKADAASEGREATIYGRMADAALADLEAIPGGVPELDTARQFSRDLNDRFTRTFAGASTQTSRSGANRIPPEGMLRRAMAGGNELSSMHLRELRQAVEFGSPTAPEAAAEMLDIQRQFLRNRAAKLVDETTGEVNATRLETFRTQNAEILREMPELAAELRSVESAQNLLNRGRARAAHFNPEKSRSAIARVAGSPNVTQEVGAVLSGSRRSGPSPQSEIRALAVLARRDGPDAVAGLQAAIMDDALGRATRPDGTLDFARLRSGLLEPRRPGQPSTISIMQSSGLLSADEIGRLTRFLDEAGRIQNSLSDRRTVDDLLQAENAVLDFVLRSAGAAAGTAGTQLVGSPNTLIAASAGSRLSRKVFDQIPRGNVQAVMIEMAQNPELFREVMKSAKTPENKIRIGMRLNLFLAPLLEQSATEAAAGIEQELQQ